MAQYKNIDIVPDETITRVHLSQGDAGRTLIFYLFENALSWSVPSNSTIKCQGTKPSGFGFSVSCTYSGNAVTCVTTEEMTEEYGQIEAELVITSSDESQVFGTSNFILDIEKNPHPSSTEDGNVETAIALTARVEALETAVSELEANEGLTDAIKLALLQLAQKVAYIDANGQDYYDDLYDALYPPAPPATLTSISAVYTQSGTVYDTDSLDSLKSDLVVTAHYSDSSTSTVASSAYTLSGTLSVGTSTVTVTYAGKTTTFTVTVTEAQYVMDGLLMWLDGEYNGTSGAHNSTVATWVDQSGNGWDWTPSSGSSTFSANSKSIVFDTANQRFERAKDSLPTNVAYVEVVLKHANVNGTTGRVILTGFGDNYIGNVTFKFSDQSICFHTGIGSGTDYNTAYIWDFDTNAHTFNSLGYLDGTLVDNNDFVTSGASWQYTYPAIGNYRSNTGVKNENQFYGEIYSIRLYNRVLTSEEMARNHTSDVSRFGLGA